jgi:hypothetical protein
MKVVMSASANSLYRYEDDYVVDTKKYKWRQPGAGRGYWRGGVWIGF